jgi:hypothetical protein
MITLPIASLRNPLGGYPEGTFDLRSCGDSGQYLSISCGYRKLKIAENANKVEIWFVPRFMVFNQNQGQYPTPAYFNGIMSNWPANEPIGIFWTWGGWDNMSYFDYLTNAAAMDPMLDLYEVKRTAGTDYVYPSLLVFLLYHTTSLHLNILSK